MILEYGVDRPGDMDYLLSIVRPKVAVVTAIGDIPVHIEFFKDSEELIAEKVKLVAALPSDGTVVLNHDDYAVFDMGEKTKAPPFTFFKTAKIASLVEVLPTEPVTPTINGLYLFRVAFAKKARIFCRIDF